MTRFFFFFIKLFLVLCIALFIAYTPGDVVFEWHGYRIHTTLDIFLGGMFILSAIFAFLYLFGQYFWRMPGRIFRAYELRKFKKGYKLLLTLQAEKEEGDSNSFLVNAQRIQTLLPSPVLGGCLEAIAYEEKGDIHKASHLYTKACAYKEGRYLGFSNLARLYFKQKDFALAKQNALEGLQEKPKSTFLLFLLTYISLENEELQDAVTYVQQIKPDNEHQRDQKNRVKAYIWYKKAGQPEISYEERVELLSYAYEFSPTFIPATIAYAQVLVQEGKVSKASKVLENAWKEKQDKAIGQLYISLGGPSDSLEEFKRAKHLEQLVPSCVEGAFLVAEAALHVKLWGEAVAALDKVPLEKRSAYYYSLQSQVMGKEGKSSAEILPALQEKIKENIECGWMCSCCKTIEETWRPFCFQCYEIDSLRK